MPQENVVLMDEGSGRETEDQLEARIAAMMKEAADLDEANKQPPVADSDVDAIVKEKENSNEDESRQSFVDTEEVEEKEQPKPKNEQNHNWEKRYKDARRREEGLRNELRELTKAKEDDSLGLTGDASPEDLAEFVQKHPDFANVLQVFIKREMKPLYEESENSRRVAKFETVMAQVAKKVPNYEELQQSQELKDWLVEEGTDSIYYQALVAPADKMNARNITRALQAFLEDNPQFGEDTVKPKRGKPAPADVADAPSKSGKAKPDTKNKGVVFGDSLLSKIRKERGWNGYVEFMDKYGDEIDKARRDGSYLYDMPRA